MTRPPQRRSRDVAAQVPWGTLVVADARKLAEWLPKQQLFRATITSPPYWKAKDYGLARQIGFGQTREQYWRDLCGVFVDIWERTQDNGSMWVIINSIKRHGTFELLPFELVERLRKTPGHKWRLEDVLIWSKPHTLPYAHRNKLPDQFEYILCFGRSTRFSLSLDAVRSSSGLTKWWVRYPERYHPHGKVPGNVWDIPIPTQGTWGNGTFAHSCPLPVALVQQILQLATKPGDAVFDPFAGTGSTLVAAASLDRRYLGLDLNPSYAKMFAARFAEEASLFRQAAARPIRDLTAANLKLRQLKYGIQLFKRLGTTIKLAADEMPVIVTAGGSVNKAPSPWWVEGVKVTLALREAPSARRKKKLLAAIADLQAKPPLSKFQVQVSVSLSTLGEVAKQIQQRQQFYRGGRFWASLGSRPIGEISAAVLLHGLPNLASDIRVTENGTRWGESNE